MYFRWGAPKNIKHLTHSVWKIPNGTIVLVGEKLKKMYGVGFSNIFFGIIVSDEYGITEYEKLESENGE